MQCEFLEEYQVRTELGNKTTIKAGSVYFIHPYKAVHLLVAGKVRPVDYGAVRYLPYMDESGRLSISPPGIAQAERHGGQEADEILKVIYHLREDSDRYKLHLHDLDVSGSGLTDEEIERQAYKMFAEGLEQYFERQSNRQPPE